LRYLPSFIPPWFLAPAGGITNGAVLSESLDGSGRATGMIFLSEGSGSPTVQPPALDSSVIAAPVPEPPTLALAAAALLAAGPVSLWRRTRPRADQGTEK
jgi:hypothetical protein